MNTSAPGSSTTDKLYVVISFVIIAACLFYFLLK